jgi:hypothetical protein
MATIATANRVNSNRFYAVSIRTLPLITSSMFLVSELAYLTKTGSKFSIRYGPNIVIAKMQLCGYEFTTDLEAKNIASEWHNGQWSALYALSSTGAILNGVSKEIADATYYANDTEAKELSKLMMYVSDRIIANNKGTQDFWSDLGTR